MIYYYLLEGKYFIRSTPDSVEVFGTAGWKMVPFHLVPRLIDVVDMTASDFDDEILRKFGVISWA